LRIIITIIILFTFSFGLVNLHCTDFDQEESGIGTEEEFPDQESWDARMYFNNKGIRRAVLTAGYIAKYSKKNYTLLKEGVKVEFFDDQGDQKSILTSDEGKYFDRTQNMLAIGNVILLSKNGSKLYSQELLWENREEKVISEVPVKITTETDTLFGDTFKSDPDLINYEITNARGTSQQTISIDDK
jgi:LPS export ABC transporter protein LptC